MREITANEYLRKANVHYAVVYTTESGEERVVGSYANESLAHGLIDTIVEYCVDIEETIFEIVRIVPEHDSTPEPYTREDIIQAVCAALLFEEGIGLAADDYLANAMRYKTTLASCATLFPGAGNSVVMSTLAVHLLATAYGELPRRGIGVPHEGGRMGYDMRAP